jgi:phosphohistidine phosphatase
MTRSYRNEPKAVRQDGGVGNRTLVILRHAKAGAQDPLADAARPLTRRGQLDATAAGAWLVRHGYTPDLVLCSPSRRTRETWHGVAPALAQAPEVSYVEEIYLGEVDDLVSVVGGAPDSAGTVLLIGHNPGLSDLSARLDPKAADPEGLSTAGIAVHTWDGDWSDLADTPVPVAATHTARG